MKTVPFTLVTAALAVCAGLSPQASMVRAESGPSGATYQIVTVCASGSMTVRADATAVGGSGDISFDVVAGGTTRPLTVPRGGRTNYTVEGRVARLARVSVFEGSTAIADALLTDICPPATNSAFGVPSKFVPMTPVRVLDTRPQSLVNFAADKPGAGQSTILTMAGKFGIALDATAVVLNLTATETDGPGFVQAYPVLLTKPGSTSNVNIERAGQTIANTAVVPLGFLGAIGLFTSTGTHLVVDVAGYFAPASFIAQAGIYVSADGRLKSVTPTRVFDTRTDSALQYKGRKPTAGTTIEFAALPNQLFPDFRSPINMPQPSLVGSVILNVTATDSSGPGFVQVAPGGALVPGAASSLNLSAAKQTIANLAIVALSATGTVSIYTNTSANLIVDIIGYFTNSTAGGSTGGLFVSMAPERVLDSRFESRVDGAAFDGSAGTRALLAFDGFRIAPASVIVNVTATESKGPGFIQVGTSVIAGTFSNLNVERPDQTIANLVFGDYGNGLSQALQFYTSGGTQIVADIIGSFTIYT